MSEIRYNSKDVGKRLKELRISKEMSRVQLARELNVSEDSISGYEKGKTSIGAEHMVNLCQLFNISADYFYFGYNKSLKTQEDTDTRKWLNVFAKMDVSKKRRALTIIQNAFPECCN